MTDYQKLAAEQIRFVIDQLRPQPYTDLEWESARLRFDVIAAINERATTLEYKDVLDGIHTALGEDVGSDNSQLPSIVAEHLRLVWEQAAKIETLEKVKVITVSEIVDALDYASEGRTWSGPKPDLLANYLNRHLNALGK